MRSTASIAGHPLHPMLIPLPLGLWLFSIAADFIRMFTANLLWNAIAFYAMAGGVIGALLAALPGFVDLFTMKASRAKTIGLWHMAINLLAVVLYVGNLLWRRDQFSGNGPVLLSCLGVLLLGLSGWLGGEMVYVHGVAVEPVGHKEQR